MKVYISIITDSEKQYRLADIRTFLETCESFQLDPSTPVEFSASIDIYIDPSAISTIGCGEHKLAAGQDWPRDVLITMHECASTTNEEDIQTEIK